MKRNIKFFMLFCLFISILIIGANNFILKNYYEIESLQYNKSNLNLINSIKTQIKFIQNLTTDYAEWDETYNYIKGENSTYINENFREGGDALKALDIDFMVYTKLDKTPVFSTFRQKRAYNDDLEKSLLEKTLPKKQANSFLSFKDKTYTFHRHQITNSDSTAKANGYLYVGKILDKNFLKKNNLEFEYIFFSSLNKNNLDTDIKKIENINIGISKDYLDKIIKTRLHLFDENKEYISSITTAYPRSFVIQGKSTLYIFLSLITIALAIIFFLVLQRQNAILNEKERFETLVQERTEKLQLTLLDLNTAISQLKTIAYIDSLTGVYSRRSFFEQFVPILDTAKEENKIISCAMIDLDDFKIINDTYGHDVGDLVLIHFCRSCEKFLDKSMILARIGGEEFVIGFSDYSVDKARGICQKIQDYIKENPAKINDTLTVSYTTSIGIADNSKTSNVDHILKTADDEMYKSKSSGKNTIRMKND